MGRLREAVPSLVNLFRFTITTPLFQRNSISSFFLAGEFVTAGPVENLVPLVKEMEGLMAKATAAVKVVPPQVYMRHCEHVWGFINTQNRSKRR
jgi:hypothetical protein